MENGGGEAVEFDVSYDELKHGDLLGRGQFGTVRKMFHEPSGMTFAVKMINDDILDSSDRRNADLEVPLKMGDGCPYLIKFYGALHAEVEINLSYFLVGHFVYLLKRIMFIKGLKIDFKYRINFE